MQNILLEDIYIDNNKLSMISNMQIKKILLGNDDFNIEYNVDDNLINFDQLIEENEMFLGVERIYSLMYLNDNGEHVPLLMNEDTNKEDLNICKIRISIFKNSFLGLLHKQSLLGSVTKLLYPIGYQLLS